MVVEELRQLRLIGVDELRDLILWCWDQSDNTGDARFCGIARTLDEIFVRWDVKGGLPTSVIAEMDRILSSHLPDVLDAPDPADASARARWMRQEVARALEDGEARV